MTQDRYAALAGRLDELTEARAEHQRLTSRLAGIEPQLREADQELARLGAALEKERADVRRLAAGALSPSRLWASMRGDRAQRLITEQAEAQAADYAYARATAHRDSVAREAALLLAQRDALGDVETGYEEVLSEVQRLAREPDAAELRDRAAEAGQLLEDIRWRRELDEALAAGAEAGQALHRARERLGSASGWSAWDTFGGGGMFSSMLKHDELDRATQHLDHASRALQRFSRELADVELPGVRAPMVDEFSRGLDIWFDNFVTDIMVGDRIGRAITQVDAALAAVARSMHALQELRAGLGG